MSLASILANATDITSSYLVQISALKIVKYWTADPTSPAASYETPYPFDGDAHITGVFYGDSTTPQAQPLTLAASAAAVLTTPGSYFWDIPNGLLIVQTLTGKDPRVIGNTITVQITYYFCTHTAKIFNGIYYNPLLISAPALSLRVEQDFSGIGQVSGGSTVLDNSSKFFDKLTELNWDGGQTVVLLGADQPQLNTVMAYSDYVTIGTWLNDNWTKTNQTFTINNLELKQILTLNIPQRLYSTTLYPNMSSNDVGNPIPLAYGQIFGATPVCIDTVSRVKIFKVADEQVRRIYSIDAVRTATATGWKDIAFTADTLNGQLTVPTWDGTSNLAVDFHGYVKSTDPSVWMDNAADMVQDILAYIGQTQINQASFDASHAALVIGTLPQLSGVDTYALNLPTQQSYVNAAYNAALDVVTGDFTLEDWIYINPVAENYNAGLIYRGTGSSSQGPLAFGFFSGGNNQLTVRLNNNAFSLLGGNVPVSQWVHVAATRVGSLVTLWVNGVATATGTYGTAITYSGEAIAAGYHYSPAYSFIGNMSEVRISKICRYLSTFTPARVLSNDANTVLYWKMNDGSGTTAADSSASGITGTLQGGATWLTINPIQDVSQLVPSIYLNTFSTAQDIIQKINQMVGSYLFIDFTGTYRYVVFLPQTGEGLPLFDDTSIINFQKDNPSILCQSQVTISFANRLSEQWGQVLTVSNPATQFSIGQPNVTTSGPQIIGLSTLADATVWAQRQLIFWGKKPSIYTLSLPWALLLRLPTDQIHIQYSSRHAIDAVFEIVEVDSPGTGLDSYQAGGASGGGISAIISNLHNFNNTSGFWTLPGGFTSGEEGIPARFSNLAGYGTGAPEWNAGWDPAIKAWAAQNIGYWTTDDGFICDHVTGLRDPVTQGQSVWF